MDIFIITDYPDICSLEIKELLNKNITSYENICFVKDVTKKDIAKITYHLQSAKKICINLVDFEVKDFKKQLKSELKTIPKTYLDKINSFEARIEHSETSELNSNELNKFVGEHILEISDLKVNLTNPDISFYGYLSKHLFLGIDVVGFDLTKRPYKISSQSDSLNGAFAYYLIRKAGITKNSCVLDPFAGTGMIPIEVALYQNNISAFKFENKFNAFKLEFIKKEFYAQEDEEKKNVLTGVGKIYAYDGLLKHVLGMQKNAKLAGTEKIITMSKINIDWLDSKIEEGEIDFIITDPPKVNKRLDNEKEIVKLYDELFYQAKYVLKNKGKLVILTNHNEIPKTQSIKHNFELKSEELVEKGEQKNLLLIFEKSKLKK